MSTKKEQFIAKKAMLLLSEMIANESITEEEAGTLEGAIFILADVYDVSDATLLRCLTVAQ